MRIGRRLVFKSAFHIPAFRIPQSRALTTRRGRRTLSETFSRRDEFELSSEGEQQAASHDFSRSTGYVALLARSLGSAESAPRATALVNLAVSGETSTSMIRTGQLAAAADAIAAADPPVVLVTLDIGGNDLLRLLGTDVCASAPQSPDCLQLLALTIQDFEANYRQIIGELTGALESHAPEARLAVMTYFNPFSGTDAAYESAAELALLGVDGRLDCDSRDPQARGMNDVIACVAGEVGAIVADIQPRFTGLGLQLTHIASEDIHANDRGYAEIADAFLDALRP